MLRIMGLSLVSIGIYVPYLFKLGNSRLPAQAVYWWRKLPEFTVRSAQPDDRGGKPTGDSRVSIS